VFGLALVVVVCLLILCRRIVVLRFRAIIIRRLGLLGFRLLVVDSTSSFTFGGSAELNRTWDVLTFSV